MEEGFSVEFERNSRACGRMREISLHILDIVQNSIAADANRIEVIIEADHKMDWLRILISDDGRGMSEETLQSASDPFWTTRTTRKVGLGLPLFAAAAEMCEGKFEIRSIQGRGTEIECGFRLSHIDRAPMGDIVSVIISVVAANPEISFRFEQATDGIRFELDTDAMRTELEDVPLQSPPVLRWIREYLEENIARVGAIP